MEKAHQKHSHLARPSLGQWGRNEWAILGTVCGEIQSLARQLSTRLAARWRMGFVDSLHGAPPILSGGEEQGSNPASPGANTQLPGNETNVTNASSGQPGGAVLPPLGGQGGAHATTLLTDLQGNWLSPSPGGPQGANDPWERRFLLNELDLVLVNGNHFEADRQILALDRRKFDSLSRKIHRLSQVELLLTRSGDPNFVSAAELPVFLQQHLPNWKTIPVLDLADPESIAGFVENRMRVPAVRALVLAGGKSTRMGEDKAGLVYHDQPHWRHLRGMLEREGLETFVSCRPDQAAQFGDAALVTDTFADLGPMGAILSAFRFDPDAAWLVVACDLPMLDVATIRFLLQYRNPAANATAYRQVPDEKDDSTVQGFPEPLAAIWEPKSYAKLLQFLAHGVSCPRKVLINSGTHLLDVPEPRALLNVNTREERAIVLEKYLNK